MEQIDTLHRIETPEGVDFEVHLAGPVARMLAAIIDLLIRGVAAFGVALPLAMLDELGSGLLLLVLFVLEWGYPIYFEMYKDGSTPGKKMMGLQVLDADATPVSWRGSVLRNLLRAADFLPFGYAVGIITMASTGRFQRLGDLAGDTVVCYRRKQQAASFGQLPDVEAVATTENLTLEEQKAIVQYAERSQRWNYSRNAELARIVDPLTGTQSPQEGVRFLQGLANWIAKGR